MQGILWLSLTSPLPVEALYNPARHSHVTLVFNANSNDWQHLIGQKVKVVTIADLHNDRIQAIEVKLPEPFDGICQNKVPHITVSHRKGVSPVESNAMLEGIFSGYFLEHQLDSVCEFAPF